MGTAGASGEEVVKGVVAQAVAGADLEGGGRGCAGAWRVEGIECQGQGGHVGLGQAQLVQELFVVPAGEETVAESGEDVFEEGLHFGCL